MNNFKAIIFDFDGVLLESIEVKKEAFRKLFKDYPADIDKIVEYHMEKGGVSRYKKFEYIYKEILHQELTSEKSEELGRLFSQYALDGVLRAPFVKGAEEFLERHYKTLDLFVASGTPEREMRFIVNNLGMDRFFKAVYGSPALKGEIALKILEENQYKPSEVIFVGDAISDWEGAQRAKICFLGRIHQCYSDPFKNLDQTNKINDLSELENKLREKRIILL